MHVFMRIKYFITLRFKFELFFRAAKLEIYSTFKCIRGHMVRRGLRYLRNYRSVQRTEAAIERLPFNVSTFFSLLYLAWCFNYFFKIPTHAHTIQTSMTRFHSVRNTRHIQTDSNDIRPQNVQFYKERILTDLNLVTWQSTVHGLPLKMVLKMRPKHVGHVFKCF
jgi:hypothetical protein